MSLWDNVKKFAQPYTDDDYDDYDEDEEYADDDYEEPEEKPARRSAPARRSRPAAPVEDEPEDEYDGNDFGFGSIAPAGSASTGVAAGSFNGPVPAKKNRQARVTAMVKICSPTSTTARVPIRFSPVK